jgi:hypothetical protein
MRKNIDKKKEINIVCLFPSPVKEVPSIQVKILFDPFDDFFKHLI